MHNLLTDRVNANYTPIPRITDETHSKSIRNPFHSTGQTNRQPPYSI